MRIDSAHHLGVCAQILTCCVSTAAKPAVGQDAGTGEHAAPIAPETERSAVPNGSLEGKVLCGYQGWFCPDEMGDARKWFHYGRDGRFEPGSCVVEMWPDVSELEPEERVATEFRHADGSVAEVFRSEDPRTIDRHFRWMEEYGIDGVFVQRFAVEVAHEEGRAHFDRVLAGVREAARAHSRLFAVFYDLSGLEAERFGELLDDWKRLCGELAITQDERYLHHAGKPVLGLWGLGFADRGTYAAADWIPLVEALGSDARYGGCALVIGVPTYWRTLDRDCVADANVHAVLERAAVVSPWTVGRIHDEKGTNALAEQVWREDLAWCEERGKDFLPVVFPGFSWSNLFPGSTFDQIPRRKGAFLRGQYEAARRVGVRMLYQAMFDEIDEGTAILKVSGDPPVGRSRFLTYEGLPSDTYLRLVGEETRKLREAASRRPR